MAEDKELEIRRQFLEEAQDHLNILESGLLGLADGPINLEKINAALRAAHSIKGGAGLMGFQTLSQLAHLLEDSFKVLKVQRNSIDIDTDLERLLLSGVDCLSHVLNCDRQGQPVDATWLDTQANPIFAALHERLGEPQAEDVSSMLSPEDGQNLIPLLFETEVEGCLERLETVLADPQKPCLQEEVTILAQELGGLGEMLDLKAFTRLCESVTQTLETAPHQLEAIAQAALQAWRHSQALVLAGQLDLLPTALEPIAPIVAPAPAATGQPTPVPTTQAIQPEVANAVEFDFSEFEVAATQVADAITEPALAVPQPDANPSPTFEITATQAVDPVIEPSFSELQPNANPFSEFEVAVNPITEPSFSGPQRDPNQFSDAALPTITQSVETPPGTVQTTNFKTLEVKPDTTSAAPTDEQPDATVRVPVKQLDQLNNLLGELTIERNGLDLQLSRLHNLVQTLGRRVKVLEHSNEQLRDAYDQIATQPTTNPNLLLLPAATPAEPSLQTNNNHPTPQEATSDHSQSIQELSIQELANSFDVLEMDRYNGLHLLSQEVMETIVQLQEVTSDIELNLEDTDQTARNLRKTSKHLQTSLTQLRMRPISDILERFPRALRELSLQHHKPVELKVHGGGTLVDRNILEALNDPLMHLVRNAFDHGLEDPETRKFRGKATQGVIEIRASHRSNRTLITISDDGSGIPLDKVRTRAAAMGLDSALLDAASDEEVLSLIFEPGFSTKDEVTDLSGRGVGMDVVRSNLKQIRGDIKVDTQAGLGTTFTLSVPFTLSITRILLTETNGMLLAFPTDTIQEIFALEADQILSTAGSEVLNREGIMVPLVRLDAWLQFNCPRPFNELEVSPTISTPTVLMVNQDSQPTGITINRCWGEQEVAIRQVEGNLPLPAGFSSCTILGDGRVVPLVSVPEMLHWIASYERAPSISSLPTPPASENLMSGTNLPTMALPPSEKSTILIVDDSINVRRFLALTLEKAGYQVEQARDGQDGIDKLQGGLKPQAIICDIEMPRLDGYGFLAKVKTEAALKNIPVAMLTSRSGDKHRQLAMRLGAAAYFPKPYNEQILLKTLKQLIDLALVV
ncbi:MAG: response regulator [Cyanothece sp. SIO1E1]|nr:response regulator [Cyanothece sp. SIO1E1]